MSSSDANRPPLVRLINQLDERGLAWDAYCLYDTLNPEALELVTETEDAAVELNFVVEGFHITIRGDGTLEIEDPDS